MATPMSACLMAAASLTASPGHGDNLAALLQLLHQAQLVLRGDATKHRERVEACLQLLIRERGELGSREALALEPEFLADGGGGDHVVARNHAHGDSCRLGLFHGELGLETERVDDADDANECEVLDGGHGVGEGRGLVLGVDRCAARARACAVLATSGTRSPR